MRSPQKSYNPPAGTPEESLSALRRFARSRADVERCELCSAAIPGDHPHLLNRSSRQIACSCDACAILFCGQQNTAYLRVPKRILKLEAFRFSESEWDATTLPIHLAFFLRDPNGATLALYPSPAGIMESMVELPTWSKLTRNDPTLTSVEPEVEALLVNRIGERNDHFIVPIDAAYRLVGIIRTKWRGLSGGTEVWHAIDEFFEALEGQATPAREMANA